MERTVEFVIIGAYLAILIVVAGVFKRFNSNISDYFRNGCKGKWWLVGSSAFMTAFSAVTFTAISGVAFEAGWSVMIIFLANAFGFLLNALFLAPWFRQIRAISYPEVVKLRFGVRTQQFYAWFSFITATLSAATWLYGLAIFSSSMFGFNIEQTIVVIGSVVMIYSFVGGSWAVMATDFIQSLILMSMTVLVAVLCLKKIGGIGAMFDMIHAQGLASDFSIINEPSRFNNEYTIAWALAVFLYKITGYNSLGAAQKYFSVKDGWEARKAAMLAFVLMLVGSFIWFIPPITARLLWPDLVNAVDIPKAAEASYAVASMQLLPLGMSGLMVVAMFAATMSSMDSGLNRNAAVFTNDIYPALCRLFGVVPATGRRLLHWGQACSVLLGVTIIATALYFANLKGGKGLFQIVMDIGAIVHMPLAIPLLMALFIKRAPSWTAVVTILATVVPSALYFISSKGAGVFGLENVGFLSAKWTYQAKILANMSTGVAAFLICTLFWKTSPASYHEKVDAFFKRMKTPVDFAKEVGEATDSTQLLLIGGFCTAIGLSICLLTVLPNEWGWGGRLGIVFVGGSVALIGALMMLAGRREQPADKKARRKTDL